VRVLQPARVHAIEGMSTGRWSVETRLPSEDMVIRARFLVDSSGRSSQVARWLGIERKQLDHLVAVCTMCSQTSAGETLPSLVEAHQLGWWYSASVPNGPVIAIFFTDSDICAQHRLAAAGGQWLRVLKDSAHTRERLSSCVLSNRLEVFPAASSYSCVAAGSSWLTIGDALVSRDPLSSSGIDFALASAMRACTVLTDLVAGRREAAETYNEAAHTDFATYVYQRHAYYSLEQRWPASTFWLRRHAPPVSMGRRLCEPTSRTH
jgi:flavin-dependent dehydrogenase